MTRPVVAIVGRPNVGKSTFFNRLIGERRSIVEDEPGTTRDRLYGITEWQGVEFTIVDTAGILYGDDDPNLSQAELLQRAREQAEIAMQQADAVLFLVDGRDGLTAADNAIADVLRSSVPPVVLAVNKADSQSRTLDAVEFYALNIGEPLAMSAYHGLGTGDVLDRLVEVLPFNPPDDSEQQTVRVAIVGRPNTGKSQLLNTLLGQQRSVVSSIPGTTRDSIDTELVLDGTHFTLIDTAGIRRAGKIERGIERYSVIRTIRAIDRCDVAVLLIDGSEGVTAQDTHIAGMVVDAKKGLALLVNKWDSVEKDSYTYNAYSQEVRQAFRFLDYVPVQFISALTGQRVNTVLPTALEIYHERQKRIPTSELNALLRDAIMRQPPMATKKGAHLRIYFATQPQVAPPVFLFFANDKEMVHWSYGRYLENRIRERYSFSGVPLTIVFRSREREPRGGKG